MRKHIYTLLVGALTVLFACNSSKEKPKASNNEGVTLASPIAFDFSNYQTAPLRYIPNMESSSPTGDIIKVNNQYLEMNGTPWLSTYGEFQFSRYPDEFWEDAILKMKSAGFYGISTYIFWIHHEEIEDEWNWKGRMNFRKFLQLCKKHKMGVFARIGPWVHGECAYGGHPEWLIKRLGNKKLGSGHPGKGGRLRSTHPEYIAAVDDLYKELGKQMEGLYWKDGGPIFAIQLDNENSHHGKGRGADLISEEKKIALKYGMEVALYTSTGWGGAEFNQDETIPTYGSYSDNFWVQADTLLRGKSFSFMPLRADGDIGTDIGLGVKKQEKYAKVYANNPSLTCETGTGMNMAFHRRTKVSAKDNGALSLVELGNGCNAMGYYTFHGGCNPVGKTGYLNESLTTGVNDNSVISNDFQGAIGEFGQIRKSFYEYPTQLLFMADFGKYLAPCKTFVPKNIDPTQGGDIYNSKLLQTAVRTDGNTGFVFINNYLMYDTMFQFHNVQYRFKLKNETLNFPEKAIDIPRESYLIWPFNLNLNGALIKYATAQPIAEVKQKNTFFFFENKGIKAEFVLNNKNIENTTGSGVHISEKNEKTIVTIKQAGLNCYFDIKLKNGATQKFVVLKEKQTKQLYKHNDRIYLSDAEVLLFNQDKLEVISENTQNNVWVYPNNVPQKISSTTDGLFQKFQVRFEKVEVAMNQEIVHDGKALRFKHRLGRRGRKLGVPADKYFDQGTIIDLKFPNGFPSEIYDTRIVVDYKASCLRLFKNDEFIYDNYYNDTKWSFSAAHLLKNYTQQTQLQLKIIPLQPDEPVYIAGTYWPDLKLKENVLDLRNIKVVPVYKQTLAL